MATFERPDPRPAAPSTRVRIVPRERLDFDLDGDIPRWWFGGDPFKTRFFDAMSTLFPQGERMFIESVRAFRDRIDDPVLLAEVDGFARQEAQHSKVHRRFNERLARQGIDVAGIHARLERDMFSDRRISLAIASRFGVDENLWRLSVTAALEHLTSMMGTCFFERRDVLRDCDPRVRAMYAWHAIEEIEHKAVAYDVLVKVAGASYARRVIPMALLTLGFSVEVAFLMNHMLRVDGFGAVERARMWARGLWWMWGPGGLFPPTLGYYVQYYRRDFHPWKIDEMASYGTWLDAFARTGDPVAASEALVASGA
ncbi:metal-dependent hydrolase [bacterium]|nr:metal-dependent hydrolase [bacterium]